MRKRTWILAPIVVFLLGFAGCPPTHEEVCQIKIPEFRAGLEGVPYGGMEEDNQLNEEEKDQWGRWARHWIEKLQLALDIMPNPDYISERRNLTRVINMLVIFHGHVNQNDTERMRPLADEMLFYLDRFDQEYCLSEQNPDMPAKLDALPSPSPSPSKKGTGKKEKAKPATVKKSN